MFGEPLYWLNFAGLEFKKSPLRLIEKMGSGGVLQTNSHELPLSSSYESAMDALSSLITRQKRGDKPNIGGKFEKMERMQMYLKVNAVQVGRLLKLFTNIMFT